MYNNGLLKVLRNKQDSTLLFHFENNADEPEEDENKKEKSITGYLHWGNTRKLIEDVDTRWNSTYFMLKWVIELEESAMFVLIQAGRSDKSPSDQQWEVAKL